MVTGGEKKNKNNSFNSEATFLSVGSATPLKSPLGFSAAGRGWIKYVSEQEGGKKWLAMTALCEITICVVCQEWEGRRRSVHGTSITPLIPPLAGYRGEDCSSSVNQCVSNPCDPEGTLLCEELANTSRCVCQHGYTGRRCATPISRCIDGLCQHGSACVGLPGGFRCDCLPGRCAIQVIFFSLFSFSF